MGIGGTPTRQPSALVADGRGRPEGGHDMKDAEFQSSDVKVERLHAVSVAPVAGAICLATTCVCVPEILLSVGGCVVFLVAIALIAAWAAASVMIIIIPD
jgi:hypothetical protein